MRSTSCWGKRERRRSSPGWRGALRHGRVRGRDQGHRRGHRGALFVAEVVLEAGFRGPPRHFHERLHETIYVLEGELTMTLGDDVAVLAPGVDTAGRLAYLSQRRRTAGPWTERQRAGGLGALLARARGRRRCGRAEARAHGRDRIAARLPPSLTRRRLGAISASPVWSLRLTDRSCAAPAETVVVVSDLMEDPRCDVVYPSGRLIAGVRAGWASALDRHERVLAARALAEVGRARVMYAGAGVGRRQGTVDRDRRCRK